MQEYDVYAIGNALVDFEYKVEDQFLQKLSIDKGHMTLIDDERVNEILGSLSGPSAKKQSGGSAANTIIAFSQLGGKGFYCFKVAGDDDGKFYIDDLSNNGVAHKDSIESLASDVTGKCLVMVTPDAERSMNTFLGVTSRLSQKELDLQALEKSRYFYIEGYLVTNPDAIDAIDLSIAKAKEKNIKIALTLSDPGIVNHFKPQFKNILSQGVDLLFCNEEEALSVTEKQDLDEAIVELAKLVPHFAITLGSNGALVMNNGEKFIVEGFPVKAVDTNGAGDMFAGAYMFGILNNMSETQSARFACFLSSKVVSQFGPRLNRDQVMAGLKEFKASHLH